MSSPRPAPGRSAPAVDAAGHQLSDRNKLTAGLLGLFLGGFGLGRVYLGYTSVAAAQLAVTWLTFGVGVIWPVVDAVRILSGKVPDAQGRTLRG